jgi:uncharacterized BrkB/YihY/UPF0761 family membrane protein
VSWGGTVAAFVWLLGSALVSWYMQRVGGYDWPYGSVGDVLGFMLWAGFPPLPFWSARCSMQNWSVR